VNLLLAGGGTGGHVYPALALVDALRRRDPASRALFVGSSAGMEARLVPAAGVPFVGLAVRPPRSGSPVRLALSLATGAASLAQAAACVARFRPDAIVATGGIAAAPAVAAGWAHRIPIVVEGNAIPGRINRYLARLSRTVVVTSEDAAARFAGVRTAVTGLPVRAEVHTGARADGIQTYGLDPARRTILVLGGSQGAARLNAAVEEAVTLLSARDDLQVLHQMGRGWAASSGAGKARDIGKRIQPLRTAAVDPRERERSLQTEGVRYVGVPYLDRIGAAYACADLVVSRCGATALAEITACGLPAILVPYRYAAQDHQAHNARRLVEAGAAVQIPDRDLGGEALAREIVAILDTPGRREAMAGRARGRGRPGAADDVLDILAGLCRPSQAARSCVVTPSSASGRGVGGRPS
jgi:UDP-N-acetylglucosamine--N-acetylmuramyl-(pentapeptide) pyrophosphoryl-undecaprenol N-acetylglucosamine transferase